MIMVKLSLDPSTMQDVINLALGEIDFDPDALKEKYLEERDKRLRDDANDQYIEVKGGPIKFFRILEQWRPAGTFDGIVFSGDKHA
jgi:hypothetical protein